jgi:superfamily II DNA or RNA helicase
LNLFPKWHGNIFLPPLPERREKVGGNWIIQRVFCGAHVNAKVADSQYTGHSIISTQLEAPFDQILLRQKGARRLNTSMPVVTSPDIVNFEQIPEAFTLVWDSLAKLEAYADSPQKVLQAWTNKFNFRIEDQEAGLFGLRPPQIGALHAISAHFAVGRKFDAATIVLPTGTGKTETMLATQVYRRLPLTLVVVPSNALRSQIANKFITLGILPEAGIVPFEMPKPRVAIIATGIRSTNEAQELILKANVIVALPNSLEASNPQAIALLTDACTDLIVDEAHHITAATWLKLRERFVNKRILQFTATPFRRDNKRVDGKIIFNYKLGDAQEAGYYRPINLRTVEEYGEQAARDRAIAEAAVWALNHDREELGLVHLLMARTKTKERADEVAEVYRQIAPELNPVVVYSGPGRTGTNKDALKRVLDGSASGSRIIVCVDMLGEGFDLPNLKIAALHDTHKSLAITLQFIGRFTRPGATGIIGEATAVVNIADPDAEKKLADLYAEGADWDRIIKRLSEERIEKELRLQDIVLALKKSGDLPDHLSLWNLRPKLSAQLFRTTASVWHPLLYASVLPKGAESWHALSESDDVLVAVVCRNRKVDWGDYQNVLDTIFDLVIIRWEKTGRHCFSLQVTTMPCSLKRWLKQ